MRFKEKKEAQKIIDIFFGITKKMEKDYPGLENISRWLVERKFKDSLRDEQPIFFEMSEEVMRIGIEKEIEIFIEKNGDLISSLIGAEFLGKFIGIKRRHPFFVGIKNNPLVISMLSLLLIVVHAIIIFG